MKTRQTKTALIKPRLGNDETRKNTIHLLSKTIHLLAPDQHTKRNFEETIKTKIKHVHVLFGYTVQEPTAE